jgi:hypothetical protein
MNIKNIVRIFIPKKVRTFIWSIVPKFYLVNTYKLNNPVLKDLISIDPKFEIRNISWNDTEKIKQAYFYQGSKAYENKIPARLNSGSWLGLSVFDKTNGDIAYIAWIIIKHIRYIEEFGVFLGENQYLLKDGFCVPHYRHQKLHTRMELERINFCVRKGAKVIYIQIRDDNPKGIKSVLDNGYVFFKRNRIISWPMFNINRELYSTLKNPFVKIIK